MTSSCKEFPSILLRSKISSNFCSSSHCTAIWSSSCQSFSSSSSSFSICEQSRTLLDHSPNCSLCSQLGFFLRTRLLLDARNHFFCDFAPNFSFLSLPLSLALLPGNVAPLQPGNTLGIFSSFHSYISLSLSSTKDTVLCGLDSKSFTTSICEIMT